MIGTIGLTLLALAAAPVPVGPPAPAPGVDEAKAAEFGNLVYAAAMQVSTQRRDAELPDLAAAAVRGMYEAAGRPTPADLPRAVRDAKRHEERMQLIGEARLRLAAEPALRGPRAYLAAVHGFRHCFDPISGLATLRAKTALSVEMDFGVGFELDGVEGRQVTAYRLDHMLATGEAPATGVIGPLPKADAIPSPAAIPWRVRRVIPGSPAHRAGLRPGDVITHLNGTEVRAETADRLFARLAYPPEFTPDAKSGVVRDAKFEVRVRRPAAPAPIQFELVTEEYQPVTVAGVYLREDGTWDGMLDPVARIGYVRVGAVERDSSDAVARIVTDLVERNCRGLVLDLRWCPGGWVDPGVGIAGMFLPAETVIARVEMLPNLGPGGQFPTVYSAKPGGRRVPDLPLVVLVGSETLGGGELIAAALQEHKRAVVIGQRTPGRAATQEVISIGFAHLPFKATYGTSRLPSGKPRHRTPTSAPTDDWGVRPEPAHEVPLTPAVAAEVRRWAEDHALRPAGVRTALPFDDPDRDPARAAALAHLRRVVNRPAAQN
jgi:hypothetical protein